MVAGPGGRRRGRGPWYYTGGPKPYGYAGFGEIFVFVFFGLVAVLGTTYVQAGRISLTATIAAVGIGLLACALLMANNLRDVHTDVTAGKRTLAVLLGEPLSRKVFALMVGGAFLAALVIAVSHPWCLLALLAGATCGAARASGARRCPRAGADGGARRDRQGGDRLCRVARARSGAGGVGVGLLPGCRG